MFVVAAYEQTKTVATKTTQAKRYISYIVADLLQG